MYIDLVKDEYTITNRGRTRLWPYAERIIQTEVLGSLPLYLARFDEMIEKPEDLIGLGAEECSGSSGPQKQRGFLSTQQELK